MDNSTDSSELVPKRVASQGAVAAEEPFIIAAFLCERVLTEVDGSLSAIRLADRTTAAIPPELPLPTRDNPIAIALTAAVAFRGSRSETYMLQLVLEAPDGQEANLIDPTPIIIRSPQHGANVVIGLRILVGLEGFYWMRVLIDDREITRTPVEVVFVRDEPFPEPHQSASAE